MSDNEDSPELSDANSSVSLSIDLDGTLLEDPLEELGGTFYIDPTDVDADSLHTVASFSHHYRVSPDNMPGVTRASQVKTFRRAQLLWDDHYEGVNADQIMPFQYQPTIAELTDLLAELREIQVYFEGSLADDFTQENLDTVIDLRTRGKALKNNIQIKGANVAAAPATAGNDTVAEEVARRTYAAMEPTLRSTSEKLKEDLTESRGALPATTAAFKKHEAHHDVLMEDLATTIKQWQGLKAEAIAGKNTDAANHCVDWIQKLEKEKSLTIGAMRVTTRRMGFLPGQTTLNSNVTNINAPKFSGSLGDKMDFFTFEDSLDEYFDTIGSYNPSLKLLKLKTDCLTDSALHSIRDCLTYDAAMIELRKLFGQPRMLFSTKVQEIKKIGKCPDTPVEIRTWAIEVSSVLRTLISLANTYSIGSMFDGSNLVKTIEESMKPRDLYKFRDHLKDIKDTEPGFSLESREKRAKYLLDYLGTIVEDATFDIDFQMTRSYRDCENLIQGKSKNKYEKPTEKPSKKSYYTQPAEIDSDSSSSSEDENAPPPSPKAKRGSKRSAFSSKTATAKAVSCRLCKKEHTHLVYCERFQKTKNDRWKQLCLTKSCPRCFRMDAGFRFEANNPSIREAWYNEHKLYCTDNFICREGKCKDRPPHMGNNIILCAAHREENENVMLEYVSSLDKKNIADGFRFFYNRDFVFSAQEPPPQKAELPDHIDNNTVIVEPDIQEPAIYMLQTLKSSSGADMLMFYDSGCYGAAISDRAYSLLKTATVRPGPTKLEVASGMIVDIEHGDEQFLLEIHQDTPQKKFAAITALRMDRVSNKFPAWPLADAWQQLNTAYKKEGHKDELPAVDSSVGGREVDILVGMRYFKYFPKLIFYLPSGLSVYKGVFKSGSSNQAILGGTSSLWQLAAESAHSMGPSAFFVAEFKAYRYHCDSLWNAANLIHKPPTQCSETYNRVYEEDCLDQCTALTATPAKLKEMLTAEDFGSNIEYRCPGCRSCTKCRNAEFLDRVSLQEEREQFLIEKSVKYDEKKQQVVASLPFILDPETSLADNYAVAKRVLQSQMRAAAKREDGAALIVRSHEKLRSKGYVARIDELSPEERALADQPGYYIPWRTVESGSLSTPLRMVFDASAKTATGFSLNCILAKGTKMLADMLILLIRFRIGPFAFSADISMAYNCVALHPDHLKYHKYLWVEDLDPDGPIVEMVTKSLIYGVKSAGNQTMVAFRETAAQAEKIPKLKDSGGPSCLKDDSYMDDVLSSFMKQLERKATMEGLTQTLALGRMSVKEFTISGEPPTEKVSADGKHVGLVGYLWDSAVDTLGLDIKPLFFGKKVRGRMPPTVDGDIKEALRGKFTRREMCGKVAGVYDPLGLVTPITAKLKLDLREIVKLNGDWDDPVDPKFLDNWVENLVMIQQTADFKIARSLVPPGKEATDWEMIVSTDASQVISAAAVYICATVEGKRECLLVAAKSKLVAKMTIPRAELRACVLGACLGEVVMRAYGELIQRRVFVTDSTVAISWINTDDRPLQVGVRNAVIQICRFTRPDEWLHVPSEENPADLATRGTLRVPDIGPGSTWQSGYPWMREKEDKRPLTSFKDITLSKEEKVAVSTEVRASDVNGIVLSANLSDVTSRYAFTKYFLDPCAQPWPKFIRRLAILTRLCNIWRKRADKIMAIQEKACIQIGDEELAAAEKLVFQWTTTEVKHFNKKETLKDAVMEDDILKYTGRFLDLSEISNPTNIFLDIDPLTFNVPMVDRYSPVAYSIMIHAHTKLTHHGGAVSTLRASLGVAYIIRGKDLAVEVRKDCVFCRRYKARMLEAEMGKIHPTQLCVAPAFYYVQIDLFGPVSSICKHFARREIKAYCAVFKCTTTLAVAAFVLDSYDTSSFLDAFHRFSCCYGIPYKVMIDAGSQLLSAFNNFEFSAVDLTRNLNAKLGVKIEFGVCPVGNHASHGLVERSIREIKKLLATMFKGLKLDLLKLETAVMWACNELNSLPVCLGNRYRDLENLDVITPARLLMGRNNQRAAGQLPQGPRPTRIARQIAEIEAAWWQIWASQKIADFVPKAAKWEHGNPDIQVGDIVVFVKDRNEIGGLTWRLGRIVSVEEGRDKITRRVTIEYKLEGETVFRTTRRSVRDVAILQREGDLDLPGVLSEAQRQASVSFLMSTSEP